MWYEVKLSQVFDVMLAPQGHPHDEHVAGHNVSDWPAFLRALHRPTPFEARPGARPVGRA